MAIASKKRLELVVAEFGSWWELQVSIEAVV
jgi:hypothetical protein